MNQLADDNTHSDRFPEHPHALGPEDTITHLRTSVESGLSQAEAASRLALYGRNQLSARKPVRLAQLLGNQFKSSVVLLLVGAALVAFAFGKWTEGAAIVLVLLINGTIGLMTELRAVRSMEALRMLGNLTTRLRRDGHSKLLSAEQIVPGDVVLLDGGDIVTADLRLVESSNLSVDESALTGESLAVEKNTEAVSPDSLLGDRSSMAFKGTHVTTGSGLGVVVATGMRSELGKISKLVEDAAPENSPIERQLNRLSGQLISFTLAVVASFGVLGVFKGQDVLLMIEASIALAVAAIPEGLPVVATIALARGMWRMAKHNALVERLAAVETLGATTVILTDKTGTLTENSMLLKEVDCAGAITTISSDPGTFTTSGRVVDASNVPCLDLALTICVLCNNAELEDGTAQQVGDPLELALLKAGSAGGKTKSEWTRSLPRVREVAFDSGSKMMATVHRSEESYVVFVKGAPEAVLALCESEFDKLDSPALDAKRQEYWRNRTDEMAARGMRVLALATKTVSDSEAEAYGHLKFVALLGLYDPPRPAVAKAIEQCRSAGIRVIMLTGDHAITAKNIAKALIPTGKDPIVVEGRELQKLLDLKSDQPGAIREADVFARVSPFQKLALVKSYQQDGEIVAMTGDGVNDAPALKQADIGVAMGLRGTQVAREAAAMVLRDDDFGSIVAAVREGRVIFRNIQKFVIYLLSCNLSEILIVGLAILFGLPLPLLPLQILFLNLVTDVFPAFALATSEGNEQIMARPPRDPKRPIITRVLWYTIIAHSLSIAFATLGAFVVARVVLEISSEAAVTVSFLTLAFAQLWHVFNMRSPHSGLILNEVSGNKFVWAALIVSIALTLSVFFIPVAAQVLQLSMPDARSWALILCMSFLPVVLGQIGTLIVSHRFRR